MGSCAEERLQANDTALYLHASAAPHAQNGNFNPED